MGININKNAKITSVESRFELTFKRERVDIAKLLKELAKGHSLESIFGNNASIASSVRKMLVEDRLIDTRDAVTPIGEKYIKYPFKTEIERGIYNLYLATVEFGMERVKFVIKMERKLVNEERFQEHYSLNEAYVGNEFALGVSEVGVMERADNKSKSYCAQAADEPITFDIVNGTYETSFGTFKMGDAILNIAKKYAARVIEENSTYYEYNVNKNTIIAKNINDFKDEDLLNGTVSRLTAGDVEIMSTPIEIVSITEAKKYAYLYIYSKLEDNNYYTIDEMNEVFQNEVLSKSIIDDSIKDKLQDFSFSMEGFEKNLPANKYEKLSYRLKVMKSLLNIEGIRDVDGFSSCRDYNGILKILRNKVSPSEVDTLYMIMGYAFARNRKNHIVKCVENFLNYYGGLVVVNKSGEGKVNEDQDIKDRINELGVPTVSVPAIDTMFHDRYLIFELKDGTYKIFLVTCEIGSLFNVETNETKGTLFEIPYTDVVKNGKSLINMIKEGK